MVEALKRLPGNAEAIAEPSSPAIRSWLASAAAAAKGVAQPDQPRDALRLRRDDRRRPRHVRAATTTSPRLVGDDAVGRGDLHRASCK